MACPPIQFQPGLSLLKILDHQNSTESRCSLTIV